MPPFDGRRTCQSFHNEKLQRASSVGPQWVRTAGTDTRGLGTSELIVGTDFVQRAGKNALIVVSQTEASSAAGVPKGHAFTRDNLSHLLRFYMEGSCTNRAGPVNLSETTINLQRRYRGGRRMTERELKELQVRIAQVSILETGND